MIRQPVVAGLFYPASAAELTRQLSVLLPAAKNQKKTTAVVLPHAGYIYSGAIAGEVLRQICVPELVILLGPNHYGRGDRIAVSGAAAWSTPLGQVPIATDLRTLLLDRVPHLKVDEAPHQQEHSLEVLVPMLQYRQPQLRIVPIALSHLDFSEAAALGTALAQVIEAWSHPVLLVASSDLNHFLPAQQNAELDARAIAAMTNFDPQQLYRVVIENQISMCGVLPVVAVMQAAKNLGAQTCELIRYGHSGETSGDNSRVVGYAGLLMS